MKICTIHLNNKIVPLYKNIRHCGTNTVMFCLKIVDKNRKRLAFPISYKLLTTYYLLFTWRLDLLIYSLGNSHIHRKYRNNCKTIIIHVHGYVNNSHEFIKHIITNATNRVMMIMIQPLVNSICKSYNISTS